MSLRFWLNRAGRSDSTCLQASHLIVSYDEHEVNNTFKFGIIYQRFGQVLTHHATPCSSGRGVEREGAIIAKVSLRDDATIFVNFGTTAKPKHRFL